MRLILPECANKLRSLHCLVSILRDEEPLPPSLPVLSLAITHRATAEGDNHGFYYTDLVSQLKVSPSLCCHNSAPLLNHHESPFMYTSGVRCLICGLILRLDGFSAENIMV